MLDMWQGVPYLHWNTITILSKVPLTPPLTFTYGPALTEEKAAGVDGLTKVKLD